MPFSLKVTYTLIACRTLPCGHVQYARTTGGVLDAKKFLQRQYWPFTRFLEPERFDLRVIYGDCSIHSMTLNWKTIGTSKLAYRQESDKKTLHFSKREKTTSQRLLGLAIRGGGMYVSIENLGTVYCVPATASSTRHRTRVIRTN